MIPPLLLGRTRPVAGDGWAVWAEDDIPATLLDRVFPPEACDFAFGDLWATSGRSGLAYGAWSEPLRDVAS